MSDAVTAPDDSDSASADEPIRMFGDPRSALVTRGPERRATLVRHLAAEPGHDHPHDPDHNVTPARGLRLGKGDGFATALNFLGILVFIASTVMGAIILYNANHYGALSDPLDSNRVAIGLAVLALGWVHSAVLIGVARALTYQLASLRVKLLESNRDHKGRDL